ncbi:hypothetical protein RU98_GL000912 [Enterococcus caccae]|nr:hypothetical protein RU98_GL000912 [Enterococcus caccae]
MVDLKLPFSIYIFEKCKPEDYVYQLDFKPEETDTDEYLQLFQDCGWEYFYKFGCWYYFRKPKSETIEENVIFSDAPSRAEMAKKVVKFQSICIAAVLFPALCLFPTLLNRSEEKRSMPVVFLSIYAIILFLLIGIHLTNFLKLNRIIRNDK